MFPAGLSVREGYAMNSVAVPRAPGEAIGAIAKLVKPDKSGESLVCNVEYN